MPRLPIPSDTEAFADETRTAVRHIQATRTSNPPPSLYLTYAGPAGGRLSDLVEHLRYHTSLTGAESELAICTAARAANADYIWNAHAKLGLKAGTREEAIHAVDTYGPLDGLTFRLDVNDRLLAEGLSNDRVTIPRFGQARVSVLATTSIFDIMQQVLALQDGSRLSYRIAGEAYFTGLLVRQLPFEKSGELELDTAEGGRKSLVPL